MTTSIDTNVIVALWWDSNALNRMAEKVLVRAASAGKLVISAPVYAELMGDPGRTESEVAGFLRETGISIEWTFDEGIWREAGKAYRDYIQRRRSGGGNFPRRILADFLIGAHALVADYTLLTLDLGFYSAAFPKLKIVSD